MSQQPNCELCGEPMPEGEEMFNYHGYSGNCPKPPLKKTVPKTLKEQEWEERFNKADFLADDGRFLTGTETPKYVKQFISHELSLQEERIKREIGNYKWDSGEGQLLEPQSVISHNQDIDKILASLSTNQQEE